MRHKHRTPFLKSNVEMSQCLTLLNIHKMTRGTDVTTSCFKISFTEGKIIIKVLTKFQIYIYIYKRPRIDTRTKGKRIKKKIQILTQIKISIHSWTSKSTTKTKQIHSNNQLVYMTNKLKHPQQPTQKSSILTRITQYHNQP